MQPEENLPTPLDGQPICSIKRHPIGIFLIYLGAAVLFAIFAFIVLVVVPNVVTDPSKHDEATKLADLVLLASAVIGGIFVYICRRIYWGNSWEVTTDSITQISQTGLFEKQSSQLSLGHLEDVTAEQDGILAHMLNYGLLKVETAGEKGKFTFVYCPNPSYYAKQIQSAHEAYEQHQPGDNPTEMGSGEPG